jgi:GR25 family glycosyltransferase involved in LPS biosynthesis
MSHLHYICKTFYINLAKRTDRRLLIENELNNYGIDYERFEAIETPTLGLLGCCISHLMVLQIAKERNYKNVLILEDDFTFLVSKEEFKEQLYQLSITNINYDVCMLAYNIIQFKEFMNNELVNKVIEAQTASGYIVNYHYYDKLINLFKFTIPLLFTTRQHWNYANDQIWKTLQPIDNWIYFKQRIGKQRPGYSDNCDVYCDNEC